MYRTSHTFSILVLVLALSVISPRVHAQTAPVLQYNPATETTIQGTVSDIQQIQHRRSAGMHLLVTCDQETWDVRLGPSTFLQNQQLTFSQGDQIKILGSVVDTPQSKILLAREVTKDGRTVVLRTKTGKPLWSGRRFRMS